MLKTNIFYVEPHGSHTNQAIAGLLQEDLPDSICYKKKRCGGKVSIHVIRVSRAELKMIVASKFNSDLDFSIFRDTCDGLLELDYKNMRAELELVPSVRSRNLRKVVKETRAQLASVLSSRAKRKLLPAILAGKKVCV